MQKLTKTVEVYVAVDGKEFVDEAEAIAHEEAIIALRRRRDNIKYFELVYNPDLTEGRGYTKSLNIAVEPDNFIGYQYYVDQILRALTKPVAYVQGVSPIAGYACVEVSEEFYLSDDNYTPVGDYKYYNDRLFLSNGAEIEGYSPPCPLSFDAVESFGPFIINNKKNKR